MAFPAVTITPLAPVTVTVTPLTAAVVTITAARP